MIKIDNFEFYFFGFETCILLVGNILTYFYFTFKMLIINYVLHERISSDCSDNVQYKL